MALHDLDALAAAEAVRRREVSPVELVTHALARIERVDGQVGAFVTVTAERALAQAREAERQVMAGLPLPPLHGVPTAIKDLNAVAGVPTGFGTAAPADVVPDVEDHVVTLLRRAGTISVGKTATPEFGLPCYTETDVGPPARTPWDLTCSAGGSSGGAGAAVAAGFVPFAQGSDGGGSIRIPASVCGLVGFKTSRGLVSKGPLDADAARLAVLGPLARTVRDAAAFLDAVAVAMPGDPDRPPPLAAHETYLAWCYRDPGTLRIGRFRTSPMEHALDAEVLAAWESTSALLADLGHEVVDVEAPIPPEAVADFETVWTVGAASIPIPPAAEPRLRPLTRHLRERGRRASGADHAAALGRLAVHARRGIAAWAGLDAVLAPTLALPPRPVGWFDADGDPAADFERQKRFTPYTAMINTTGQPAVSVPLHVTRTGLPIGMMLIGRPAGDAALLMLAAQLEAARPWHSRRPVIWDA